MKTSVESVPQHELDDCENLESHHVFADFENVLHSLGFIQVYFDELKSNVKSIFSFSHISTNFLIEASDGWRYRNLGLLDRVVQAGDVVVLFFDERRQFVPDAGRSEKGSE